MSINHIIAGSMAIVGLGGGALVVSNPTVQADFKNVQTAIANKDLSGFKTAKTQLVNDKSTAEIAAINATTQDQLNAVSDKQAKRTATNTAITNNDYNAFKASADPKMLKRTPDQASFDKLVASQKAHAAETAAVSDAIKNNDFNAFKIAETTGEQDDGNEKNGGKPEVTPTDAQLQVHFDQMVADYKATGVLPTDNKDMMGGDFESNHGGRGHKGGSWNK